MEDTLQAVVHLASEISAAGFTPQQESLIKGLIVERLLPLPFNERKLALLALNQALATAPAEGRYAVTQAMVSALASLSDAEQLTMIETQAAALAACSAEVRVTRMADMMGAISLLPQEQRRRLMEKMATLLA